MRLILSFRLCGFRRRDIDPHYEKFVSLVRKYQGFAESVPNTPMVIGRSAADVRVKFVSTPSRTSPFGTKKRNFLIPSVISTESALSSRVPASGGSYLKTPAVGVEMTPPPNASGTVNLSH